jgi:class 3 adenylate cyclase/predicted ATPase
MFCDLVDSTALSARLDPEEFRNVVRSYQAACGDVIARFEGHIAQYLGDGLLVYFGHPRANEDDAHRAVRAGLAITASIRKLSASLAPKLNAPLSLRVGIHTGLVVMGEVGSGTRHEHLALGETPNLAARLQGLADPDAVVISAATHRLVEGFFVSSGPLKYRLKGFAEPLSVYQVLDESGVRSRLDVAAATGLTPLVGREQELDLLLDRWRQVTGGQGQAVLLMGDAGIGKSRLVQAMRERIGDNSCTTMEFLCSAYYANSPLYPVIDFLPRVLEWRGDDSNEVKLAKLEQFCGRHGLSAEESLPLLASLLSLPVPAYPLAPMSPERQKQRTLETLLSAVLSLASARPVLLIVEDLHWVDPTTLELLTSLLEQAPTVPLFALLTARPNFRSPWTAYSHLTLLTLDRLTKQQSVLMVEGVAGKHVPPAMVELIVDKTDGVALFVEELTKMVLESGLLHEQEDRYELTAPLPPLAIPSTLQDSLTARLDRLDTGKTVAQLSSTIGRAFSYRLLSAISNLDEATLERDLARLVDAELVYQHGVPPEATYTFKHALIQEAAYQSLLRTTRQQNHQRIAQVMVEKFSSEAEVHPEVVAHHYTEAGMPIDAVMWWQKAGQSAVQRASNIEAVAHFTKGLEVLKLVPASLQRDQVELGLQVALGYALIPVKGWASAEAARAFTRAGDLCRQVGEAPQLFRAMWGLGAFHFVRGDQRNARDIADQCLSLARRVQDIDDLIEAHYLSGIVSSTMARFASGRVDLEESVRLYGGERRKLHTVLYGQDPKASSWGWLGMGLWALGYPDEGLQRARDALSFAEGTSHPFALARGFAGVGILHVYRREPKPHGSSLETAVALCMEQGFAYFGAVISAFQGANLVLLGHTDEGIALMRESIQRSHDIGSELLFTVIFALLADAHCSLGQRAEGLAAVAEGLTIIDRNEEHWGEAELHRLKGELLSLGGSADAASAETSFRQAIDIARRQQAKSYELRASISLARLWEGQHKRMEARRLLRGIYDWFSEGLDTLDLKEARVLLQKLQ